MAVLSFSNADMRQCKGLGGRSSTPRDSRGGGFGQWEVYVWGLVPYKPCQIRLYRSTGNLEINYVWKPWLIMLHKSVWSRNMVQGLVYKVLGQYKRRCRISIRHVRSRRQERTACLPRDQARRQFLPVSRVSSPVSTKYSKRRDGMADHRAPRDIRTNEWVFVARASSHDHAEDPVFGPVSDLDDEPVFHENRRRDERLRCLGYG
jgi:hypothetical protein